MGKDVVENRNYKDHEKNIQDVLEIGRRHKIMNPEKMRGEYGKLIYMLQVSFRMLGKSLRGCKHLRCWSAFQDLSLEQSFILTGPCRGVQDSVTPEVQGLLDMKLVKPITTVHSYLAERGADGVLVDPLITTATREILQDGIKTRLTLNRY